MKFRFSWTVKVLVVLVIISMFATACGSNTTTSTATSTTTATASKAEASTASDQKPQNAITLDMYGWTDSGYAIDEVIKKFQAKNPNITINFSGVGTQDYPTTMKAKLLSGEGIDFVWGHPGAEIGTMANAGFLMDLTGADWATNVQGKALEVSYVKGKLYGIPAVQNLIGVYYNKKIFNDLGIKIPTTWSEFTAACDKIKKANIAPVSLGLGDWTTWIFTQPMQTSIIASKNPKWCDDRTAGKVSFNEWVPMFDKYVDVIKNYSAEGPKGALGIKYDTHLQLLLSGKAAMLVNGTWALNDMLKMDPNAASNVGMFPLNGLDDPSGLVIPQGVGMIIAVSAKTKYKEEANKFLKFMSTPESYIKGNIPVVKGVTDMPDFIKDYMMPAVDKGKTAVFYDVPFPPAFRENFDKDISKIITLSDTPANVMKNWDKVWDESIKKANNN